MAARQQHGGRPPPWTTVVAILTWLAERVELLVAELDLQGAEVLAQVLERQRARNGQGRGGALEQPRQRDLRGGGTVALGDGLEGRRAIAQREVGNEDDAF